jgi:chromosome segregation ATPase
LKVVAYSEQYEHAFLERRNAIDEYDSQLASLKAQHDSINQSLEAQDRAIDAERARLDSLLKANRRDEYNAGVPGFNAMINRYNSDVDHLKSLISQYNEIVVKRNSLASESQALAEALDSRIPSAQQ